jgi:hypothetical protein
MLSIARERAFRFDALRERASSHVLKSAIDRDCVHAPARRRCDARPSCRCGHAGTSPPGPGAWRRGRRPLTPRSSGDAPELRDAPERAAGRRCRAPRGFQRDVRPRRCGAPRRPWPTTEDPRTSLKQNMGSAPLVDGGAAPLVERNAIGDPYRVWQGPFPTATGSNWSATRWGALGLSHCRSWRAPPEGFVLPLRQSPARG